MFKVVSDIRTNCHFFKFIQPTQFFTEIASQKCQFTKITITTLNVSFFLNIHCFWDKFCPIWASVCVVFAFAPLPLTPPSLFVLRLTHPTKGIVLGSWAEVFIFTPGIEPPVVGMMFAYLLDVCYWYEFCVNNPGTLPR